MGLRDLGAVKTWLFSIAVRKAIDAHRAHARAPDLTDQIEERAVAQGEAVVDKQLWERVRSLPESSARP